MNYQYKEIIRDKLGNEYIQQEEYIKENQCRYCKNKKHCRLEIEKSRCVNYKSK